MTGASYRYFPRHRACALLVAAFVVIGGAARVQGQGGQVVNRTELLRTQTTLRDDPTTAATGNDETYAVATPNDPDLGEQAILKRSEQYRAFTFSVAAPFSYTSNVALTNTGENSDVLFTPGFSLAYAPRITRTLFANISVGQQFFFYDKFTELDFASFDARVGLSYVLPQLHNLLLRINYDYNSLTDTDLDQFFSNHTLTLGAEMPFRIGRAQQISVGTDLNFTLAAEPDEPGRHDFSLFVGYSANVTRDLTLSAVGRVALREYVEGDRTDISGILALNATYRFTKWLSANAVTTLATSDSNRDVFDYDVFNIGGALALGLRF